MKPTISLAIALVLSSGCGLIQVRGLPGGEEEVAEPRDARRTSGAAHGPVASSTSTPSSPTAEAEPPPPTDDQVARVGVQLLTGALHEADFSGDEPVIRSALTGEMYQELRRRGNDFTRRWFRANRDTGGSDPIGSHLTFEVCMLDRTRLQGKPEDESGPHCGRLRSVNLHARFTSMHRSQAARIFWFERFVEVIEDPTFQRQARHAFARALGHEPVFLSEGGFVLRPVPMEEWSPRVLQVALTFAEGDSELVALLQTAQREAPTHYCTWFPAALVREPRGSGFSQPAYDRRLTPRPDVAGSGGSIDCEELPRAQADASLVRIVRRDHSAPRTVEVVTPVDGQLWVTNRNALGMTTSQTRIVRVYRRIPY